MELAERMRKVREIRGMKQNVLARKMGITPQTFSVIENGGNLKLRTLQKFCEATQIPLSYLLATDAPITDENLSFFDRIGSETFYQDYIKLQEKLAAYEALLFKDK
jgi:transcriptional regulator with XRE-family HTH domain